MSGLRTRRESRRFSMAKNWKRWSRRALLVGALGIWMVLAFWSIEERQRTAIHTRVPELSIVFSANSLSLLGKFDKAVQSIDVQVTRVGRDQEGALKKLSKPAQEESKNYERNVKRNADSQLVAPEERKRMIHATKNSENITCDLSHFRTDVCYLSGDVRVSGRMGTVALLTTPDNEHGRIQGQEQVVARVKPYTRKWEKSCMDTIGEVAIERIPQASRSSHNMSCGANHSVPAVIFSTGGYTGNVYHEFNDGLIPLYLTANKFRGEVVLVILELHKWWMMKYGSVIRRLSHYPVLDFDRGRGTHCFPGAIVGLTIHDELAIPEGGGDSMHDFQQLLKSSFGSAAGPPPLREPRKPRLVLLARKGSSGRVLLNQNALCRLARRIGFHVVVLSPNSHSSLFQLHEELHSAQVMVGVHGAALTHFLFMRPGSVVIQIVPLGTEWAARTYYGQPAQRAGLRYVEYRIEVEESSLARKLGRESTAVAHPEEIASKGWWEMKRVYLASQDVTLSLRRFRPLLLQAYREVTTSAREKSASGTA